jgi:AbrB family looped-hinge helix DNA binding protein
METTIDRFGRVIIPKTIREHLGLRPGSKLIVEEHNHDLLLRTADKASYLEVREGVVVYTGKITGDIEHPVQSIRDERLDHIESK